MKGTLEVMTIERSALRSTTEVSITCRPFTSSGTIRSSDGVMHNFSIEGSYIETTENYSVGTILIVRMVGYSLIPLPMTDDVQPRSISLAEVKWHQQLVDENTVRYGLGLKYLN
jgi:hypothetical protein